MFVSPPTPFFAFVVSILPFLSPPHTQTSSLDMSPLSAKHVINAYNSEGYDVTDVGGASRM